MTVEKAYFPNYIFEEISSDERCHGEDTTNFKRNTVLAKMRLRIYIFES